MPTPMTPQQARAATHILAALDPTIRPSTYTSPDPLSTRFAASVINHTLTGCQAAFRACDEATGPALPEPSLIVLDQESDEASDAAAADTFASRWIAGVGTGAAGADRGEAATWFRTRAKTLPTVVALASEAGFDVQCWQLAAYCNAALVAEGALAEAIEVTTAGLAAAERIQDEGAVAIMHLACGGAATMTGHLDEAMEHYDTAMPIFQRSEDVIGQANIMLCRGAVHMRRRELDEARTCQLGALEITTDIPVLAALATGNLGSIALQAGRIPEAIHCGHAALHIIEGASIPAIRQVMEVNSDLTEAYLAIGDLDSARRHADAAQAAAQATTRDMSFASVQVAVLRTAGRLALAEADPATALHTFSRALAVRTGSTTYLADLLEGVGLAALAAAECAAGRAVLGKEVVHAAGLGMLESAVELRRRTGDRFHIAGALAHLADAYQDEDPQHASCLRNEAIDHLKHLHDTPASRLRDRLAAV